MMRPGAPIGDLHSHLIPGVDDGARTLGQALEGIGRMVRLGVRLVVTTPHLEGSLTLDRMALQQRLQLVEEAWSDLKVAVQREHPEVTLARGFEVALDVPEPNLEHKDLRLAGTRAMLVEWPRMQIPPATPAVVAHLRGRGVRPIVAHPERYVGNQDRVALAAEWKQAGAYLQVNYGSLLGRYGSRVRTHAFRLLRAGLVDVLSSDFHGRPHLELHIEEVADRFEALGAYEHFELLTSVNPFRVARDLELLAVPELPAETGFWGRIRELFQVGSP